MFNFKGLGMHVVREKPARPLSKPIATPEDAIELIKHELRKETREVVVLVLLDSRNQVIGIAVASIGTVNACMIHPREIFLPAVACGAVGVIVAHNHPSGNCEPSAEDKETAKRLVQAGELIGIPLIDFLVLTPKTTLSFKGKGII